MNRRDDQDEVFASLQAWSEGVDRSVPSPTAELAAVLAEGLGTPAPRRTFVPTTRRARIFVGGAIGLATLTGAGAAGALPDAATDPVVDAVDAVTPFDFGQQVKGDATGETDGEPGVDGQEVSDAAHERNEARQAADDGDDTEGTEDEVEAPETDGDDVTEDEGGRPEGNGQPADRPVGPPEDHTTGQPADRPVGPPADRGNGNGPNVPDEGEGEVEEKETGQPADRPVGPPEGRGNGQGPNGDDTEVDTETGS